MIANQLPPDSDGSSTRGPSAQGVRSSATYHHLVSDFQHHQVLAKLDTPWISLPCPFGHRRAAVSMAEQRQPRRHSPKNVRSLFGCRVMPDDGVEQPLARRKFLQTDFVDGFVDQDVDAFC